VRRAARAALQAPHHDRPRKLIAPLARRDAAKRVPGDQARLKERLESETGASGQTRRR
jgi:hypothetical protein